MNAPMRSIVAAALIATTSAAFAQSVDPKLYEGMRWRSVGPMRGGRSLAIVGSTQRPNEYYFGATGGGVWKTTNGGTSWTPVSDGFFGTSSVGALAIAPSNPDIVVAGTGERDIRGNISHGDGVYRSDDAGRTWRHIGLKEAQTIARVSIHPTDPNTMWVAALGHIYGRHPARGVYKTTDGGKTWRLTLPGTLQAGAVDLDVDPTNPNVIVATLWDAWRTPHSMNSGGPTSGIYKSTDGGETWTNVSRAPGLPSGILGKIGVAISAANPKRYYAIVEAESGGIFRSDDAGASWELVNDNRNWRQRAWYYSHVYADPKDADTMYVLNVGFGKSTDGGKTFSGITVPHVDNHDLWIAPDNPLRMANSNDGGGNVSTDGGRNWTEQTYATAQFYHVSTDNAFPYRILGAQQDNSTVRVFSRTQSSGIGEDDWEETAGGESGYVAAKPNDPDVVFGGSYGGYLSMFNHRTQETRNVNAWPDNPMGHGAADLTHRFQWTFPIVFSPHDPETLYTCSQYVLRSRDGGGSWTKISPDLTRNDKSRMGPSGGPITKDNTSVEYYGTVFTLAESPKRRGVLWAGSDDGLVHVSQDGGKTWTNVTPRGMPDWGLVSMIDASPHHAGTAWVAVDNHENDDLRPYAFRTTDYGKTWTPIVRGVGEEAFVRVVREDRKQPGLLYMGTETGMYVSFNAGDTWQTLQLNLPNTPIHDLAWKEDDLIAATHGRSFWVLDDLTPLQQLAARPQTGDFRFFAPKDAYRVRWGQGRNPALGQNPLSGVVLSYYLAKPANEIKLEFVDGSGRVFMTTTSAPKAAGFQRTSAFLQYPSFRGVPGMILWAAGPRPIFAPPGSYEVRMTVDGATQSHKFRWMKDPRSSASDRDLVEQFQFLQRISERTNEANDAVLSIRAVREGLEKANVGSELAAKLTRIEEAIYQTKNRSGQDPLNYPIRLNNKIAALIGVVATGDFKPTKQSYDVFEDLSKQLEVQLRELDSLIANDLKAANSEIVAKGGTAIVAPPYRAKR